MDLIKEVSELKETVANKIGAANRKIRAAGGNIDESDINLIDKLSHSLKSLAQVCAMLEAEEEGGEEGYSKRAMYNTGYAREGRGYSNEGEGYSREGRGYSREGRGYSREGRGYSRKGEMMTEQLKGLMEDAPDDMTRQELKKLIERLER